MSCCRASRERVVPLLGFEWGFDTGPEAGSSVELRAVASISSSEWTAQLPTLRSAYPGVDVRRFVLRSRRKRQEADR